jgi:hypothetical protein
MRRRGEVVFLMLATLAVSLILIATQPRDVFWGPDSGNRFIQLQSLLRTGGIAIEHRFPLGHHFVDVGGKTYSMWAPTFSVVTAPFYSALGLAGLFVLPIVGTLLLIALLPVLTERSITLTGILLVFGTPLLWYTIVFWEYTLAAAIAVGAFVLAQRDRPLLAGVLAGISTLFREEGYIAIASIALAILITRRTARPVLLFVAGAVLPLVPWWVINWKLFGNPLGLHAAIYSSIARGNKLANFYPFLFEFSSVPIARIVCVIPAIALLLLSPVRSLSIRPAVFALTSLGFAALAVLLFRSPTPIRETLYTQGLFPGAPLSVAIFLAIPRLWRERTFALVTVIAGIVLTTLTLNQSDFGATWGPRHYLWILPLIVVLAMQSLEGASRLVRAAAVLLVVCSFAIQFRGIVTLRNKLQFSKQVLEAVRKNPAPVVLTDVFWVPEDLAAAFYEKQIGFVSGDHDLAIAMNAVRGQPFLFVAARQFRLVSNRGFAQILPRVKERQRIAGADPMLDVMLLDVR